MCLLAVSVLVPIVIAAAPVADQEWTGRARVDGRVLDERGSPFAGATVAARHLELQGGPRVKSDIEGRFVLDGITAGSWMVEVGAPGYTTRRIGVHLPSESSWLDIIELRLEKPRSQARFSREEAAADPASSATHEDIRAALAEGRVDRALTLLSSVDANDPAEADLLFEIGQGLLTAGETEEAVTMFSRALVRDPAHVDARYGRALSRLALGHREGARHDLEAVRGLRPGSAVAEKAGLALEQLATARGE